MRIMKLIYAKDIKAITKMFNLSEDENWFLKNLSDSINSEKSEICMDVQEVLLYNTHNDDKRNAVKALLVYFGAKAQKENDLRMLLDQTTWKVADMIKCGSYQLKQWFKSIATYNDRFGKFVECSDTFGLNYLEIA